MPPAAILAGQANGLEIVITRDLRGPERRRMAIVASDYLYHDPVSLDVYLVPRGYVTDFASIPFPASIVLPPFGLWTEGAVVHDYLYAVGESGRRPVADRILKTAMEEQGLGRFAVELIYWPVRLFARAAYGRETEWTERFGDPVSGEIATPPFAKPGTAIVASSIEAEAFEDPAVRQAILASHSHAAASEAGALTAAT